MELKVAPVSPPSAPTPISVPVENRPQAVPERTPLGPAYSLSITAEAAPDAQTKGEAARQAEAKASADGVYIRDTDSRSYVFQVVDPLSGDVTIQIPSEVVLKARVYARESSEAAPQRTGAAVEKKA